MPLFFFSVYTAYIIFFVIDCVYIIASGPKIEKPQNPFDTVEMTTGIKFKLFLSVLYFLIFRGFLISFADFIVVFASCNWYYKKGKSE